MKRALILLAFLAADCAFAQTRYEITPTYTTIRFSIVKWGVIKDEGRFRDFAGALVYDAAHPERSRIDVVVQAKSLDTMNADRDATVRSPDFLDVARYPTLEFHSTGVAFANGRPFVTGDLTIRGVTKRIRFPATALGMRELPRVGKLAAFETTFTVNRRDYGVLGARWGAVPGVLADEVEIHIVIGAVARR